MERVIVVTRSFQRGVGGEKGKPFDACEFEQKVALSIKRLLKDEVVKSIVVMVNGEPGNRLAEIQTQGETPTMTAMLDYFPEAIKSGRIIVSLCTNWGDNVGSGTALNEGLKIAQGQNDIKWVLNWSPDIEMDGNRINHGLAHAERHNLSVVGYLRQNWWERPQWNVAQNTACLWNIEKLSAVNGFSPECNGTGRTTNIEGYGEVSVAGMEDFHAMLRMMKQFQELRWGMVGRAEPLFWNTDFKPGSDKLLDHQKKVARQYAVMQIYAKDIFPELSFHEVMNQLFARYYQD